MLNVIYEDNHVIVVIKPQNIPSQGDVSGDKDMINLVRDYLREKYNKPGNVYVGLVHRLDRPTGGVMVFAKTSKAAARLTEQIKNGIMQKFYYAVVEGTPKKQTDKLSNYLKKNTQNNMVTVVNVGVEDAKMAELEYETVETVQNYSLIKVKLITGRSHQIRVQMKHIGNPLVGDMRYNPHFKESKCNMALWASELKFVHPTTKENLTFKVFPPTTNAPWKFFNWDKLMQ